MDRLAELTSLMISYMSGDARRIQHFIKVHGFAALLGRQEGLNEDELFVLESAALVHDIGIKKGEEKHGKGCCTGKHQEEEGPAVAREMLLNLQYDECVIERVCYLVGHHHTYSNIEGLDYQLLVEADFLVNLYEDSCSKEAAKNVMDKIFKTKSGIRLCKIMYEI
jgi:uncharacterized protein